MAFHSTLRLLTPALAGLALAAGLLSACSGSNPDERRPAERANQAALAARAKSNPSTPNSSKHNSPQPEESSAGSDSPSLKLARVLVAGASRGKVEAVSTFPGPDGLVGVETRENNNRSIVFMTANGEALLPMAINDAAENLIDKALVDRGLRSTPEKTLTAAARPETKAIIQGTRGPIMTVFMDPNCAYCNKFFKDFQGVIKAGKVRVRYVMIGFLKPSSAGKAAAILAAKNPLDALTKDEMSFDGKNEEGGIAVDEKSTASEADTVAKNGQILAGSGPISTPAILACVNGKVQMSRGAPNDPEAFVANLGTEGHPACAH